jgi:hypothetical protein
LEVSKGEIKGLKVKLFNSDYQDEENKTKNQEQYQDIMRINEELAGEN